MDALSENSYRKQREGKLLNIRKPSVKARCMAMAVAALFLLPASAHAEDYVLTFNERSSSPHEIALPLQLKFAVNLHQDGEEKRTQLHDKVLASIGEQHQSPTRLNVARLDQREGHIESSAVNIVN